MDVPTRVGMDWRELLAFGPGDRLTHDAVRRSLANLHASGLTTEAEIFLRREDGANVAVVALYAPTWVTEVDVVGELGLDRDKLLRQIEQDADASLVEEDLLRSVYALQGFYEENGYLEARVQLEVSAESADLKRRRATFRVASGPRATVGKIAFVGDPGPWSEEDLRRVLRSKPEEPYNATVAAADAQRLKSFLVDRGHLQARVGDPKSEYDTDSSLLHLTYDVDVGPHVDVEVLGARRKVLRRKGLLPFLDEEGYDDALLSQSRDKLLSHYQRQGYYRAEITTEQEVQAPGEIHLQVAIDRGPEYTLDKVIFEGNRSFSDRELRQLITTSDRRGLRPGSGRLVSEVLREDIDNLISFYVLEGFSQIEVGPPRITTFDRSMELLIPVREGPRQRVVNLRLPGMTIFEPDAVRRQMTLQRGGPFHSVLLDSSVNLLRALYEEEGFDQVVIQPELDWNPARTLVDVDLRILEGRPAVVERVILRGHRETRPEVLRRITDLESGDTISRRRLLEAERDLYRLGVFSRVDVDTTPRVDATGGRDVVVRLDEGSRWRLAYGLSYHSDDGPGGLLSLSRNNIGGRGDRLQLDLRINERDRRYRFIFDQPSLGRTGVPITYTLFRQDEQRESFSVQDLGFQTALTKDFPNLRLGLAYEYREVDLLETEIDPIDIDRQDSEVLISSFTPNLFIDRRDDPLEPTRGSTTSAQLEMAFPFAKATANFAKLFVQQSLYADLGPAGVLATSFRLGAIESLDTGIAPDPLLPADLPSALIPMSERFFAGGRTTHRAYERDRLGVLNETLLPIGGQIFEAGGNGLLLVNLDYRFPLAGAVGGSFFIDLGNVWADWRTIDIDDVRPGAGLGVRYLSPIGPVRLEVGWKLDPQPGERETPVFFLSLGNPF